MDDKTVIESFCGLICSKCEYREKVNCKGCIKSKGKLFYGECDVAKCAISKEKRFCGECEKFPCDTLKKYSYDKEQGDDGQRIENCRKLKDQLVSKAREGVDPISVCGHHCDYCFMGKWCGGCRSEYNCCSFATIFDDKMCPNVKCANDKKIDGCYECEELETCKEGFYGIENQYAAKATAYFIRRYGKEKYTQTLKKAIDDGLNYAKDLDESGSVDAALALLEKYL